MKKHVNIPIFIPHYGCPNACVFCNQKKITGKQCYNKDIVINEIKENLATLDKDTTEVELAFFGGSFTAIPREEMIGLLEISDVFLSSGDIESVRLSTRPDAITPEILDILHSHGVKTIELGLQSFSDTVLTASQRGHTAAQSEQACKMIKEHGFKLIGQMMVGLPLSTLRDEIMTAQTICELGCDGARIYPTVVFPETELMDMMNCGSYTPLTNEDAIDRSSKVLSVFASAGVPVIRIGLCSNETLKEQSLKNNYHPSIGELILCRYYRMEMDKLLADTSPVKGSTAIFKVANGKISQAVGQKRENILYLSEKYKLSDIKVIQDCNLKAFELLLAIN